MSLTIATWNINSVRLRIDNVERYLRMRKPDVLCLQETKCPDEHFPHMAFEALGYKHRLVQGMKSYNGVAIVSKVPFKATNIHHRCGKEDCRHIEVALLSLGGLLQYYVFIYLWVIGVFPPTENLGVQAAAYASIVGPLLLGVLVARSKLLRPMASSEYASKY